MRREREAAVFSGSKQGYQPWQIIMLSTCPANWRKDRELIRVQLGARAFDQRQVVVRVDGGGGVAGKMFAAARDPFPAQGVVKGAGQPDDLLDVPSVAAAAKRVIRLVVEGNVEHRTKIEIETEKPQQVVR